MKCPICKSTRITRSHDHPLDSVKNHLFVRNPYRCHKCDNRFWRVKKFYKYLVSITILITILFVALKKDTQTSINEPLIADIPEITSDADLDRLLVTPPVVKTPDKTTKKTVQKQEKQEVKTVKKQSHTDISHTSKSTQQAASSSKKTQNSSINAFASINSVFALKWLQRQPNDYLTLQLMSSNNLQHIQKIKSQNVLKSVFIIVPKHVKRHKMYTLAYGSFATKKDAQRALKILLKRKPFKSAWIRNISLIKPR